MHVKETFSPIKRTFFKFPEHRDRSRGFKNKNKRKINSLSKDESAVVLL